MQSKHAVYILLTLSFVVFFTGFKGDFQGDDNYQIVENAAVHNFSNVGSFFQGSTFWNGETLVGSFYRPLMTTTFSLTYTLFGANPVAFHIVQLLLFVAGAFVLYLLLKNFFKPVISLAIASIYLVHPVNSQAIFAIPSVQEPLFMLFGLLALLLLTKPLTTKNIFIVSGLLLLSLLSKETAVVFMAVAFVYIVLFSQKHLARISLALVVTLGVYLAMRIGAVGLMSEPIHAAPISNASLVERLFTLPSILAFYFGQFFLPVEQATSYYWLHTKPTLIEFYLPLLGIIVVIVGLILGGRMLRSNGTKKQFRLYLFFVSWLVLGLLPHLQLVALDMTACEPWLISSTPAILGILALLLPNVLKRINPQIIVIIFLVLLALLGARTALRGLDYANQGTLAYRDIQTASGNYLALNNLGQVLIQQNNLDEAKEVVSQSIAIYPNLTNHTNLGAIYQRQGDVRQAKNSYEDALRYGSTVATHENLGQVYVILGNNNEAITYFEDTLKQYPRSSKLWFYYALLLAENGSREEATAAIQKAATYGPIPESVYRAIIDDKRLELPIPDSDRVIRL